MLVAEILTHGSDNSRAGPRDTLPWATSGATGFGREIVAIVDVELLLRRVRGGNLQAGHLGPDGHVGDEVHRAIAAGNVLREHIDLVWLPVHIGVGHEEIVQVVDVYEGTLVTRRIDDVHSRLDCIPLSDL